MEYIQANLSKDEKVKASIDHSWTALIAPILIMIICIVVSVVFFNLYDLIPFFKNAGDDVIPEMFHAVIQIIFSVMGVIALIFGIIVFIFYLFAIKFDQLILTDKRLLGRRGFIRKTTVDIMLSHVDTIEASNGILGAIFHYGDILIASAATGGMRFEFISNTLEFRKAVLDQIEEVKAREREEQARLMKDALRNDA